VYVNGSVVPVVPLVNIDGDSGARMVFFDDHGTTIFGTTFFHYYRRRGRRDCGCRCVRSGGHWRLRTCCHSERQAGESKPGNEC
jgi:hypothetical protein